MKEINIKEIIKLKKEIENELIQKIKTYGIRPLARETKMNVSVFTRMKKKANNLSLETLLIYDEKISQAEKKLRKLS